MPRLMRMYGSTDSEPLGKPVGAPADRLEGAMFEQGNESRGETVREEDMYTYKEKHFVDQVRIHMYGGKGGMGCASHMKSKTTFRVKPTGGSGGDGGAIWLKADIDEPDLSYIRSKVLSG